MTTERLRELAANATPGPWSRHGNSIMVNGSVDTWAGAVLGSLIHAEPTFQEDSDGRAWTCSGDQSANAAFIAACDPQTVLALLDRIAELEALLRDIVDRTEPSLRVLGMERSLVEAISRARDTLSTPPRDSGEDGPREWPKHGPPFNAWEGDLPRFVAALADANDEAWWSSDTPLKYLEVRIDTRDNGFILYDRDRNRISPDRVIAAIAKHRAMIGGTVKLRTFDQPAHTATPDGVTDERLALLITKAKVFEWPNGILAALTELARRRAERAKL